MIFYILIKCLDDMLALLGEIKYGSILGILKTERIDLEIKIRMHIGLIIVIICEGFKIFCLKNGRNRITTLRSGILLKFVCPLSLARCVDGSKTTVSATGIPATFARLS